MLPVAHAVSSSASVAMSECIGLEEVPVGGHHKPHTVKVCIWRGGVADVSF